jgi:5'-methylthioadenosine phosphorylase
LTINNYQNPSFGIIGGSGFYDFLNDPSKENVETPFGSVDLLKGEIENTTVYFLNRHGSGHSVPPHAINYKANLFALWKKKVKFIISTTAVGALKDYNPGEIVLLEQFVDFVSPPITYFDGTFELKMHNGGKKTGVIHTDYTEPYCPLLRNNIENAGKKKNIKVQTGGVYVLSRGPRFETPAEISIMAKNNWGNVVGMTNPNEVILARELEIHYATISIITNYAAGISKSEITHLEVLEIFNKLKPTIQGLLEDVIKSDIYGKGCTCIKYPK